MSSHNSTAAITHCSHVVNPQPRKAFTPWEPASLAQRRFNMARLVLFFAFPILVVSIATPWVFKMVVDKAFSIFPSELPERPQKAAKLPLAKRLSQKLASSKSKRKTSTDMPPPFPFENLNPAVFAPAADKSTSPYAITRYAPPTISLGPENEVQASPQTQGLAPRLKHAISSLKYPKSSNSESRSPPPPGNLLSSIDHQATFQPSSLIRRKPISLTTDSAIKDPLVERFERLKLPQNGKLQPRSVAPAVAPSPPLTPLTTSTPPPPPSTIEFLQAARLAWDGMAVPSPTFPVRTEQPSLYPRRSDGQSQPKALTKEKLTATHPVVIDEDSDEGVLNPIQKRSRNPFQRHMRLRKHPILSPRHQTTSSTRNSRRRSRSPSISSSDSEVYLTPDSSQDVSYLGPSVEAAKAKELRQSSEPELNGPRFIDSRDAVCLQEELDRRLAQRLQQEEEEAHQTERFLYIQLRAACQPSARGSVGRARQRKRNKIGHSTSTGTRENPIDLESESSSDSDDEDRMVFTDQHPVLDRSVDYPELMDLEDDDWNWSSSDELHPNQTNLDATLAQLLQEEEESNGQVVAATRDCAVCGDSYPISELPSLADCEHSPQTCATCYAGWVTAQLQGSSWREAKCPESECKVKLTYYEVQQTATPEIFLQYDTFIARAAISEDRKF